MLVLAILVGLIVMLEYLLIKYTDTPSEIAMGTLVCGMFLLLAGIVPAIIGESAAKKVATPTVIYSEVLGTKNTSRHPLNPKQIIYFGGTLFGLYLLVPGYVTYHKTLSTQP